MNQILQFPPSILGFFGSMILIILISALWLPNAPGTLYHRPLWTYRLTITTLIVALIWAIMIYPAHKSVFLTGHFMWDPLTALLIITTIALSIPIFIYIHTISSDRFITCDDSLLALLSLFGAIVMLTSASTISFYLGLEIMSLPLYGLVGLGPPNKLKAEATMKYIMMGILTNILLLYGFCLLYVADGNFVFNSATLVSHIKPSNLLIHMGEGLLFTTILFKLGAIPFHFWVPDVYTVATFAGRLLLATVSKYAAIGMGVRLFRDRLHYLATDFQSVLIGLGVLSAVIGNLVSLRQTQMMRLLGYSSIAHMGFIVLGFTLPIKEYAMVLFYGFIYCFMMSILLGILAYLQQVGLTVHTIQDLQGLNTQHPKVALFIAIILSSMAGLPPFVGFFSKFGLLYNLIGQKFYTIGTIVLIATVIGSYYYINIIRLMYFDVASTSTVLQRTPIPYTIVASTLLIIGMGLYPSILLHHLEYSIAGPFNPSYETSVTIPKSM